MTTTPSSFDSPFLQARAVRHGKHPTPFRPATPLDPTSMIPWREFVQAIFELPAGWDLHGNLPEGISSQQFWSRVNRAARQATRAQRSMPMGKLTHARIGIVTRGERFWVWPITVPPKEAGEKISNQKRGWIGELFLKLRSGEPVVMDRELSKKEKKDLRARAERRGWRLHISKDKGKVSRVQWIGEATS